MTTLIGGKLMQVDKSAFKNIIVHTDTHNRVKEMDEMWKEHEKKKDKYSRHWQDDERDRSRENKLNEKTMYSDVLNEDRRPRSSKLGPLSKKLMEFEEKDPDRWGHSGFQELYPEDCGTSSELIKEEIMKDKPDQSKREEDIVENWKKGKFRPKVDSRRPNWETYGRGRGRGARRGNFRGQYRSGGERRQERLIQKDHQDHATSMRRNTEEARRSRLPGRFDRGRSRSRERLNDRDAKRDKDARDSDDEEKQRSKDIVDAKLEKRDSYFERRRSREGVHVRNHELEKIQKFSEGSDIDNYKPRVRGTDKTLGEKESRDSREVKKGHFSQNEKKVKDHGQDRKERKKSRERFHEGERKRGKSSSTEMEEGEIKGRWDQTADLKNKERFGSSRKEIDQRGFGMMKESLTSKEEEKRSSPEAAESAEVDSFGRDISKRNVYQEDRSMKFKGRKKSQDRDETHSDRNVSGRFSKDFTGRDTNVTSQDSDEEDVGKVDGAESLEEEGSKHSDESDVADNEKTRTHKRGKKMKKHRKREKASKKDVKDKDEKERKKKYAKYVRDESDNSSNYSEEKMEFEKDADKTNLGRLKKPSLSVDRHSGNEEYYSGTIHRFSKENNTIQIEEKSSPSDIEAEIRERIKMKMLMRKELEKLKEKSTANKKRGGDSSDDSIAENFTNNTKTKKGGRKSIPKASDPERLQSLDKNRMEKDEAEIYSKKSDRGRSQNTSKILTEKSNKRSKSKTNDAEDEQIERKKKSVYSSEDDSSSSEKKTSKVSRKKSREQISLSVKSKRKRGRHDYESDDTSSENDSENNTTSRKDKSKEKRALAERSRWDDSSDDQETREKSESKLRSYKRKRKDHRKVSDDCHRQGKQHSKDREDSCKKEARKGKQESSNDENSDYANLREIPSTKMKEKSRKRSKLDGVERKSRKKRRKDRSSSEFMSEDSKKKKHLDNQRKGISKRDSSHDSYFGDVPKDDVPVKGYKISESSKRSKRGKNGNEEEDNDRLRKQYDSDSGGDLRTAIEKHKFIREGGKRLEKKCMHTEKMLSECSSTESTEIYLGKSKSNRKTHKRKEKEEIERHETNVAKQSINRKSRERNGEWKNKENNSSDSEEIDYRRKKDLPESSKRHVRKRELSVQKKTNRKDSGKSNYLRNREEKYTADSVEARKELERPIVSNYVFEDDARKGAGRKNFKHSKMQDKALKGSKDYVYSYDNVNKSDEFQSWKEITVTEKDSRKREDFYGEKGISEKGEKDEREQVYNSSEILVKETKASTLENRDDSAEDILENLLGKYSNSEKREVNLENDGVNVAEEDEDKVREIDDGLLHSRKKDEHQNADTVMTDGSKRKGAGPTRSHGSSSDFSLYGDIDLDAIRKRSRQEKVHRNGSDIEKKHVRRKSHRSEVASYDIDSESSRSDKNTSRLKSAIAAVGGRSRKDSSSSVEDERRTIYKEDRSLSRERKTNKKGRHIPKHDSSQSGSEGSDVRERKRSPEKSHRSKRSKRLTIYKERNSSPHDRESRSKGKRKHRQSSSSPDFHSRRGKRKVKDDSPEFRRKRRSYSSNRSASSSSEDLRKPRESKRSRAGRYEDQTKTRKDRRDSSSSFSDTNRRH